MVADEGGEKAVGEGVLEVGLEDHLDALPLDVELRMKHFKLFKRYWLFQNVV